MKNDLPDVSDVCFATQSRKHCLHYEEDGYCCGCRRWHPDMCEKGCGEEKEGHSNGDCTPVVDPENNLPERPIFDLVTHIYNQREHSLKTFGPLDGGQKVQGILKHIEKEVDEIRKDPQDLEEYIDVIILAIDAAYRSGSTPEQIAEMLMKKQLKNEARQWPDWRGVDLSQPLEHIRTEEQDENPARTPPPPLTFKYFVRTSVDGKYHAIYTNPMGTEFEAKVWDKIKPEPPAQSELPEQVQERLSFDANGSPV